jgi:hypothetical protein
MTRQSSFSETGLTDDPTDNPAEWNKSLISRKLVRREYVRQPAESENACQKRLIISLCVFLAVIALLSATAVWVMWSRIHGL